MKKIIHVDMDAFYASVEQRDFPEWKGKPVAVGGSSERGVVAAASYEARKYGVKSAMPSKIAVRKCPHLIFARPRFEVYKEVSNQIRAIFHEYTDLVEPLSLDEAYLDVTHNKKGISSATLIAKAIRKEILEKTQLTASAGISVNKFLAKTASDVHKPDGVTLIPPENILLFLEQLPIGKFFGIGKVTAKKMIDLGIHTGADLKKLKEAELKKRFGKSGVFYYNIVRGIDNRAVNPSRERKSLGAENTFLEDLTEREDIMKALEKIADTLYNRMRNGDAFGKTLTIKIKFSDFQQITRSKTVDFEIKYRKEIITIVEDIMRQVDMTNVKLRLLGISISNFKREVVEKDQSLQLTFDF
jgi:DNA polymerase-4